MITMQNNVVFIPFGLSALDFFLAATLLRLATLLATGMFALNSHNTFLILFEDCVVFASALVILITSNMHARI